MNPQETQQVARDEKWVPFSKRVKVSSTNVRLETTVPQKEETFQVVIDLVKNSSCFKAFTISSDVPEIFMQQLWYSIKKVQGTDSYEFLLANKKCVVNDDVFRIILDICPRVEGVNFTDVPDDDTTLAFLIKLAIINKENVDYPELIWEDLAYQIDHRKEKRSRREKCHFPNSPRLKFVRIDEDYQEYGLPILETMLIEAIKQSESYQMFIKYPTSQIRPKKSRVKVKRKTSSKRRVKKKVTLSADDNIIYDDLDHALELGKSISKTKAKEAEAAKQVHATHARIVTEFVLEPTRRRKSRKVTSDPPKRLKGVPSLTLEEQEAADIMQALKESKKTSKRQPGTRGSNEGTGTKPGVPDESTVVFATSSEETGTKPGVPNEEKEIIKENVILEWGSKQESEHSDEDKLDDKEKDENEGDADDEDDETEYDEDDIYKYKIRVRKDKDEEMINAEVKDSDKGDEEVSDAAKVDAEKTSEAKDDAKKTELPPTRSSLSVSSGFGDQFLKLSSDSSLVSTVKDTTDAEINSMLEVKIQSEVPHIQSPSMLSVPVFMISGPTVLTPIQESPSKAIVTTLPPPSVSITASVPQQTTTPTPTPTITTEAPIITTAISESDALSAVQLRVAKLEKDVSDIKKIDLSAEALASLKIQVPSFVDNYLGSKFRDTSTVDLEQGSKKSASKILRIEREQAEKQQTPKFTIKSTDQATLNEYDQKSVLYQTMHANKSFNRNPANHRLYHALMEALIEEENAMDKGVADIIQDHKRKHDDDEDDDDEDPPTGPNQGKKTKRRRTKESESSKKPSSTKETPIDEEPIAEVIMDDAGDYVVHDDDQPQDASEPKTTKTLNQEWFKQPPRPPTPNPEWNKRQVVLDQPKQPWFNQMVSTTKDPLTFNDLMATPIDFSNIELEYNFQECFNVLTDRLDWNNPEGDRCLFDLSKPLPLQGPSGHRAVAVDYFFNNDLEYLKTSDPVVTYTTSITKIKVARYEIEGIEDMVPTLWCPTKHNLYSTKKIIGVKSVSVKKLHGYGHLEEIVVKRDDRQLYKFKEGDFVDLHMNDIEDMLLFAVQHKLLHLTNIDIVDFIVALHGTLKKVRDELHHRVLDFDLGYNKEMEIRKWTTTDKKRSALMVELIDK
ncbi:hypothetical protein Tco_1176235 [Tanacetum coccineum]